MPDASVARYKTAIAYRANSVCLHKTPCPIPLPMKSSAMLLQSFAVGKCFIAASTLKVQHHAAHEYKRSGRRSDVTAAANVIKAIDKTIPPLRLAPYER